MSKAVLISIRPEWCAKIASWRKTMELRKTRPKLVTPFKCYIYCTLNGAKEYFHDIAEEFGQYEAQTKWYRERWYDRKGKVIGEFVCDDIEAICANEFIVKEDTANALAGSCLTKDEAKRYAGWRSGAPLWECRDIYGWNISDLVIYDTPKELSEFYRMCPGINDTGMCWECDKAVEEESDCGVNGKIHLTRPPQSWCYVEELIDGK